MAAQAISTRLPAEFVGEPPRLLKPKARYKRSFSRLPFVAPTCAKTNAPFWHVPATGGERGGYETGKALAYLFLKYLRGMQTQRASWPLALAVQSLMERYEEEGGIAMERSRRKSQGYASFRRQSFGFLETIALWLTNAAQEMGDDLDRITEADLTAEANAGLGFDHEAFKAHVEALYHGRAVK